MKCNAGPRRWLSPSPRGENEEVTVVGEEEQEGEVEKEVKLVEKEEERKV